MYSHIRRILYPDGEYIPTDRATCTASQSLVFVIWMLVIGQDLSYFHISVLNSNS